MWPAAMWAARHRPAFSIICTSSMWGSSTMTRSTARICAAFTVGMTFNSLSLPHTLKDDQTWCRGLGTGSVTRVTVLGVPARHDLVTRDRQEHPAVGALAGGHEGFEDRER